MFDVFTTNRKMCRQTPCDISVHQTIKSCFASPDNPLMVEVLARAKFLIRRSNPKRVQSMESIEQEFYFAVDVFISSKVPFPHCRLLLFKSKHWSDSTVRGFVLELVSELENYNDLRSRPSALAEIEDIFHSDWVPRGEDVLKVQFMESLIWGAAHMLKPEIPEVENCDFFSVTSRSASFHSWSEEEP